MDIPPHLSYEYLRLGDESEWIIDLSVWPGWSLGSHIGRGCIDHGDFIESDKPYTSAHWTSLQKSLVIQINLKLIALCMLSIDLKKK
jgi:hypothetical protein